MRPTGRPLVEAVVLDLDDTLLDHRGSVRQALAGWLPSVGAVAGAHLVQTWFALETQHFDSWRAGLISFDEQRRRRLRDFLPLIDRPVGADDELDAVFAGYLDRYAASWRAFDDVRPTLDQLAELGVPAAVLTNGSTTQQHAKVDAIGVRDALAAVLTAEELGVAKPAPEAYLAACRVLGVHPSAVVHVGDRHDVDVLAARAAGLRALHLDRDHRGTEPPAGRITTLAELPDALARHDDPPR